MLGDDEIVISGISGRFPESANLNDFWENLYNGVDMVTDIKSRWDVESLNMSSRMGQLKDLDKFDASFMGVHGKQAEHMDPRLRILLELTHEAIIDAGINPATIRGSRTGVYVGASGEEAMEGFKNKSADPSGYCATGCVASMLPNRISFTYDLKGPSMTIDSACSSSLLALHQALLAIRAGLCDSAVVAGVHLCLDPKVTVVFTSLGMASADGKCRSFDAAGQGYVRSEAAVVLYITKANLARRSYATILHGKTNVDGYKTQGITFPSGQSQEQLMREVYAEAGVNPNDVDYVEAHGTGTSAGDPEEVNAITRVFCEGRSADKPLLIGSVKSNMGHPEPASGLCQIAKIILANQHGVIPGNLHYSKANPDIPALKDGRIKVVSTKTDFHGSLVGLNSFGFGGANVHVVLKLAPRVDQVSWESQIPFIVPFSGRTAQVETSLEKLMQTKSPHLVALLQEIAKTNIPGHNFRSYAISNPDNEIKVKVEETQMSSGEKRPIWFMLSGMGSQYIGMVQDMMTFHVFRDSIRGSIAATEREEFDLAQVLYSEDERVYEDGLNSMAAITATQVALIDLLRSLGIVPDGIFGHSLGEVASAYADGCLTAEETILVCVARGRAFNKAKVPGTMASIGLSWAEATARCPENVYATCHNSIDNVTISGPEDLVTKFMKELEDEGIFARRVHSSGFAFHSRYMNLAEPYMREYLSKVLPTSPTKRTCRWISTSVPEDQKNSDLDKYGSVDYFVNNVFAPVRYYEATQLVPRNAVVIEIAPHNLMQAILKRNLPPTAPCLGLMNRKASRNVLFFLDSLGQMYLKGCNPNFGQLYNHLNIPATGATPMISPAVCWDHSESWSVPSFQSPKSSTKSFGESIWLNLTDDGASFYSGHVIDGRTIFPATGYMLLVWTTFAKQRGKKFEELPIIFENLRFERNTMLRESGGVEFFVNIFPESGDFEVYESDSSVFRGQIRELTTREEMFPELDDHGNLMKEACTLETEDFYKELRLRGYQYSGVFRGVQRVDSGGRWAELGWNDNWVGFLDTLLQISILQHPHRGLYLPIRLQKAIIDPVKFLSYQSNHKFIPVKHLSHIKTLKGPWVEFRGLKVSIAPRRLNTLVPTLSKQYFVAYTKEVMHMSLRSCFDFFLEIVTDNTPGRNFIFAEFRNGKENSVANHVVKNLPIRFENSTVYLISDETSDEFNEAGVLKIPSKSIGSVKNANFVAVSNAIFPLAKDLVVEKGFVLIRDGVMVFDPEYQLVAQKLQLNLRLYRRRQKCLLKETKSMVKVRNMSFEWVEEVQNLVAGGSSKVILYTEGAEAGGILGFVRCLLKEGYDRIRCFCFKSKVNINFEKPSLELKRQINLDLVFNVYESGLWGCYCSISVSVEELSAPRAVTESFANALHPGDLSTVQWIESPLVMEEDEGRLHNCQVHYSSLNFRDVMLATGKLSRDALPGDLAFQECVLGLEFAGVVNEKRVCGMQKGRCLATSVKFDNDKSGFVLKVPDNWSLAEAATIPTAYATAYYGLIMRAQMQSGEVVLIHAGSGGVGQAAIRIALSRKCKVITTVSRAEKRKFLRDRFPELTEDCFADSRNASMLEKHVMEVTDGRGVDIVLNSLAQDKLEASVRCLAKFGRFLEIGKFDLFNNTSLGMEIFLRSVNFQGILLDDVIQGNSEDKKKVVALVQEGMNSGIVEPLPYSLFPSDKLEDAFRFMATGKHMGKVVVAIRDEPASLGTVHRTHVMSETHKDGNRVPFCSALTSFSRKLCHPWIFGTRKSTPMAPSSSRPCQTKILSLPRTYFHSQKSYVLVGGLGGMGLEVANWMVSRGARGLVFVSRSGVRTGYQAYRVMVWRGQGVGVIVNTSDVSTPAGAESVLRTARSLGPVGGIFNLALVLKDATFPNQTAETFEMVAKGKIKATVELDKASRNLGINLDYFVLFSSISSSKGNAGQSSYAFANDFMERLCEDRCREGLHGLAIQWGAIGEVGVLHDMMGGKDVEIAGVAPQKIASCLEMLDLFLHQPHPVMSSFLPASGNVRKETGSKTLVELVSHVLAIKDIRKIKMKATLVELGMDSLMAMEIKILLENEKNVSIPVTAVGQLTFSKLEEMESSHSKDSVDFEMEFKQLTLLPMPKKAIVPMESRRSKSLVLFLVHPLDGTVSLLEALVKEVDMRVYGLQCVKEAPLESVEALAGFYVKQLRSVQEKGPFHIGGYSYGATIAFEMTIQLEQEGEVVENLVLLDGCHIWTKLLTHTYTDRPIEKEDVGWLLYFLYLHLPIIWNKVEAEMSTLPTFEARLEKTVQLLHAVYADYSPEEIRDLAVAYSNRLSMGYCYEPSMSVSAKTTLIRAGAAGFDKKIGNDYQLSQVCEIPPSILTIDGHHHCFHRRPLELGIPKLLNSIFDLSE